MGLTSFKASFLETDVKHMIRSFQSLIFVKPFCREDADDLIAKVTLTSAAIISR